MVVKNRLKNLRFGFGLAAGVGAGGRTGELDEGGGGGVRGTF